MYYNSMWVTSHVCFRKKKVVKLKFYYTIMKSHIQYVSFYFLFLSERSLLPAPPSKVKVNLRLPFDMLAEQSFSEERTSLPSLPVGTAYL